MWGEGVSSFPPTTIMLFFLTINESQNIIHWYEYYYFVAIYGILGQNNSFQFASPALPPTQSKEHKNGTLRPFFSLFLYLLQSGFNRQVSYVLLCHAKQVWEQFIFRILSWCSRRDVCRGIYDLKWETDVFFEGNSWILLSHYHYCKANVTQWSQKPHVFVKPRRVLRPVQRPSEIRGVGGAGVSLTSRMNVVSYFASDMNSISNNVVL